jgi:hypothetical protein
MTRDEKLKELRFRLALVPYSEQWKRIHKALTTCWGCGADAPVSLLSCSECGKELSLEGKSERS